MAALVISVRLHDGRYHGQGDWPPSPARLFQALVAGAGLSGPIPESVRSALAWLETLPAPLIASPRAWQPRRSLRFYVPNNDSDAIGGDPASMARIRTATKIVRPWFFDATIPFLYVWNFQSDPESLQKAKCVCSLAEFLYQLGRGWDMAWAWAEIVDQHELHQFLSSYPGEIYSPSEEGNGTPLRAPCSGSLESLERRHAAFRHRFSYRRVGRKIEVTFHQPPKPRLRLVPYSSPASRQVYELRDPIELGRLFPWPLESVSELVIRIRDAAVEKLERAMPERRGDIERVLIGRQPDGSNEYPPERRVRIIALPSIGHVHADREIRRILVETPSSCLLSSNDVQWAFSGLDIIDHASGDILATLVPASQDTFLRHYGIGSTRRFRLWRTVTPLVLPRLPRPRSHSALSSPGSAQGRMDKLQHQACSVLHALRHAGLRVPVETMRIQREPFEPHSRPAADFSRGSRFNAGSLHHVEIQFTRPISGPLVLGDGRFLGLGLMAPVPSAPEMHVFRITGGLSNGAQWETVSSSLRRAVMALLGDAYPNGLPSFFSGHAPDGSPANSSEYPHLAFGMDPARRRVFIIAPNLLQRRPPSSEEIQYLAALDERVQELSQLRAGRSGLLSLSPANPPDSDPLFRHALEWKSLTPYLVTRHFHSGDAILAIRQDVRAQLAAHGLPEADIAIEQFWSTPRRGLEALIRLRFASPVSGPILIGRNRFLGGGLFSAE